MKKGDIVKPRGFPSRYRPGSVQSVAANKVVVTWTSGSGWEHSVEHHVTKLEEME